MQKDRSFWSEWAHFLQHLGLAELVAALLEIPGPLNLILAQVLYAGGPFLSRTIAGKRLDSLAGLFEDQEESRSFAAFLREETTG